MRAILDSGKSLPYPDGLIINGGNSAVFTVDQGIHKFQSICSHPVQIITSVSAIVCTIFSILQNFMRLYKIVQLIYLIVCREDIPITDIECGD